MRSFLSLILSIGLCIPSIASVSGEFSSSINPPILTGLVVNSPNSYRFDFIATASKDEKEVPQKEKQYQELVDYFFTALTIPNQDQWVNLSPFEQERMFESEFGKTQMCQAMLELDLKLKHLTASLLNPSHEVGRKFWQQLGSERRVHPKEYSNVLHMLNKVWIVPDRAVLTEDGNGVYVTESRLKVMMQEDDLAKRKQQVRIGDSSEAFNLIRTQIVPYITKEINEGKDFIKLRQIYSAMLLATWYKEKMRTSDFAQEFMNQAQVRGLAASLQGFSDDVFTQYVRAYKKGVFQIVQEEKDPKTGNIVPRKYAAGGLVSYDPQEVSIIQGVAPKSKDVAMITVDMMNVDGFQNDRFKLGMDYSQLANMFERIRKHSKVIKNGILAVGIPSGVILHLDAFFKTRFGESMLDLSAVHSNLFGGITLSVVAGVVLFDARYAATWQRDFSRALARHNFRQARRLIDLAKRNIFRNFYDVDIDQKEIEVEQLLKHVLEKIYENMEDGQVSLASKFIRMAEEAVMHVASDEARQEITQELRRARYDYYQRFLTSKPNDTYTEEYFHHLILQGVLFRKYGITITIKDKKATALLPQGKEFELKPAVSYKLDNYVENLPESVLVYHIENQIIVSMVSSPKAKTISKEETRPSPPNEMLIWSYKVLGVEAQASLKDVERAYKKRIKEDPKNEKQYKRAFNYIKAMRKEEDAAMIIDTPGGLDFNPAYLDMNIIQRPGAVRQQALLNPSRSLRTAIAYKPVIVRISSEVSQAN